MTAAEVRNAVEVLRGAPRPEAAEEVRRVFAERVAVDWQGEQIAGRAAAAERWLRRQPEQPEPYFRLTRVEGQTAERATVTGDLIYYVFEGDAASFRAPVTMAWTRDASYLPVIERMTVGAFERVLD